MATIGAVGGKSTSDQRRWILEYLLKEVSASAVDQQFHEGFHELFGGSRKTTFWGAQPVRKAQRLLLEMCREGLLERGVISLHEHEIGFPNWVYGYTLKGRG